MTSTSSLYLMAISSTLPSRTSCWNRGVVDMHGISLGLQHLFSSCVRITIQCPQLHHSGLLFSAAGGGGGSAPGPGCGCTFWINSALTKSANTAGCLLSSSKASL